MKNIKEKTIRELALMPDSEIDCSDIPELDNDFWKNTEIVYPTSKKHISLRLDQDILDFFKSEGKNYQTRINAVLRTYMTSQQEKR